MTLDADACYRALRARDARFDGLFYVGVETTGVYCRPVCPARTPGRERCRFFSHPAQAEHAGFRACFRCRPELAPGAASVDSIPRLVRSAAERIEAGWLDERSIEQLASSLGVTSRHLRRSIASELGVTPIELAQTRRLALAKQLLHDTSLPLAQVAFAAGFASVRRFNASFRARFGRAPSSLRREHGRARADGTVSLRLDYRPPLPWPSLLEFLALRAIPGVEHVDDDAYRRTVAFPGKRGWISVRPDRARASLRLELPLSLAPLSLELSRRVRALFDLDARPDLIADELRRDPLLASEVASCPGLRVPGAFDGFETAVRAVLGQQVSVRAATTLAGRLAARWGTPLETPDATLVRTFPPPALLAELGPSELAAIGLPHARAQTLIDLSRAVADGRVDLDGIEPERLVHELQRLRGIGPWTAQYVAMRATGWPDAFPAGDLGVRRALAVDSARAAESRSQSWRPWRAYAVMYLWRALARGGR